MNLLQWQVNVVGVSESIHSSSSRGHLKFSRMCNISEPNILVDMCRLYFPFHPFPPETLSSLLIMDLIVGLEMRGNFGGLCQKIAIWPCKCQETSPCLRFWTYKMSWWQLGERVWWDNLSMVSNTTSLLRMYSYGPQPNFWNINGCFNQIFHKYIKASM